jgi:hypothetical protein
MSRTPADPKPRAQKVPQGLQPPDSFAESLETYAARVGAACTCQRVIASDPSNPRQGTRCFLDHAPGCPTWLVRDTWKHPRTRAAVELSFRYRPINEADFRELG